MFDEIRDFVVKNKIWFIIGGIICAMFGAVMAALISLYFLIAVAVGLIVAVVSGLVKNKEIKGYESNTITEKKEETPDLLYRFEDQKVHEQENNVLYNQDGAAPPISETPIPQNNEELEEYKKEARERITEKYVQELDKSVNSDVIENNSNGSILIQNHGFNGRGTGKVFDLIQKHFYHIDLDKCSEIIIRGDIEVLFEVLTGVDYNEADEQEDYYIKINIEESGHGNHCFGKCFFEHTILCACALYKNQNLLKFDSLASEQQKKLDAIKYCNWLKRNKPIISFEDWNKGHKHGSVLNEPNISNLLDPNPSK